ncbi:MAG TPA: hypothetical protein DD434_08535, partial [Bacteroidales bacterium]|nr:hypothetical protein [Bacteroidales bacterium]
KISHIAYLSKEVSLTKKNISKSNTINLNISLADKTTPISEIVIRTKPYYRLERLVYDFEIDDNYVYTITNKNDKKHLSVYTFEDYRKRTQEIPKECNEVSFDCHNKLRVKQEGREDYWRISSSDTSLKYTPYDSVLNGIGYVIANPKNYVQRNRFVKEGNLVVNSLAGMEVSYITTFDKGIYVYCFDKDLYQKAVYLYRLYESKGMIKYKMVYFALMDIGEYINFDLPPYMYKKFGNTTIDNSIISQIEQLITLEEISSNFIFKASRPMTLGELYLGKEKAHEDPTPNLDNILVYYRLTRGTVQVNFISNKNYLYIFNYEKGLIHIVNKDNILVKSLPMDSEFLSDYKFIDDILFNRESNRCFIVIKKFASLELKELNLETGKYINTINLGFPNVEKIRMVGNYLYYTVPVEGEYALERQLYKQKISEGLSQN